MNIYLLCNELLSYYIYIMVQTRRFRGGKRSRGRVHRRRSRHHSTPRRKVKRHSRRGTKRRRRRRTKRMRGGGGGGDYGGEAAGAGRLAKRGFVENERGL
jgi:hypothetical protein